MQLVSFFLVLNVPGNFGVSVLFCIVSLFPSLQSGGQLIDLRISDFILISDEEETERLSMCSSCIQGKNKQKAPYEVGKMDKHIVRGDEVGNDDDSLDDNHAESGMRVAENAQKTAPTAAQASTSTCRCLPITATLKPPLPHRPVTRLFQAAHNRNRVLRW